MNPKHSVVFIKRQMLVVARFIIIYPVRAFDWLSRKVNGFPIKSPDKVTSYKNLFDTLHAFHRKRYKQSQLLFALLIAMSLSSFLLIFLLQAPLDDLLRRSKWLNTIVSNPIMTAATAAPAIAFLYALLKNEELDDEKDQLMEKLSDGISDTNIPTIPLSDEDFKKLTMELFSKKMTEDGRKVEINLAKTE